MFGEREEGKGYYNTTLVQEKDWTGCFDTNLHYE